MIEAYKNFGRAMSISRAVQHVQIIGFNVLAQCLVFTFRFLTYINHDFRGNRQRILLTHIVFK